MRYTTVEGNEIVGGIEDTDSIGLDPVDAVFLSFEKFDFNISTTLVSDRSSRIEFVGISISKEKLNEHTFKVSGKVNSFTRKW